ncbi:MAG: LptF/LptG family permease [Pseudomonadota bacterium]|nr:LptF/LptG family permease [Pseudomonadota bacterium]
MRLHLTLSIYIGKLFLFWWASVFLILSLIIALFDIIELLRITASANDISFQTILSMVFLKLPTLTQKAVPFTILFGAMLTFWHLNKNQEFVVARSSGVSAWEFLLPAVFIAIVIGIIQVTIYGPLSSTLMIKFEQIKNETLKRKSSLATLAEKGIWFRQATPDTNYILHGAQVEPGTMALKNAIILRFNSDDKFVQRIDAPIGYLARNKWVFPEARIAQSQGLIEITKNFSLPTELTKGNIQDSFAKPNTFSIWQLPKFIDIIEKAGFSGVRHRIYFYSMLITPLLLCAMVLFAGVFTLHKQRRGGGTTTVTLGVAFGFILYFGSDLAHALGQAAHIPPMMAALSPSAIALLVSTALLFYREDG